MSTAVSWSDFSFVVTIDGEVFEVDSITFPNGELLAKKNTSVGQIVYATRREEEMSITAHYVKENKDQIDNLYQKALNNEEFTFTVFDGNSAQIRVDWEHAYFSKFKLPDVNRADGEYNPYEMTINKGVQGF